MKKSKKQKRKSKNKSKNQLKHKMLYTDKEYKYFLREIENLRGKNLEEITQLRNLIRTRIDSSTKLPVTDLNITPLWGTDSNLHRYRTKVIHGGEYFTNLYYRIIDWFSNVMSKIDTFTNSLSENFGIKWIVKFFKFFNIGDFLSIVFSLLTNIIDYLNKNVIRQLKPGLESMVKDISAYGINSKWTWIMVTVGSLGIFDYISVGTTFLNGTGIPTWILTNINSNLNPFNFIWNVICIVGHILGSSIVIGIQTIWNISIIGPLLATLLILLPFLLLALAYDTTLLEENNEYYRQRAEIDNETKTYKTHDQAMQGVEKKADKLRTEYIDKQKEIRKIAEKAVRECQFLDPGLRDNLDTWRDNQILRAINKANDVEQKKNDKKPKISLDEITRTVRDAITNFNPPDPRRFPSRNSQKTYIEEQAKVAGVLAVESEDVVIEHAEQLKVDFIAENRPNNSLVLVGGTKSLRNFSQEKIEEANEKYPTNFTMAQLGGLITENEKGEYYYTEQADKAMDIMKKDIDRIITDNCSGEICEQTSMTEKIEAIIFVHSASIHASIRKDTESKTSGGGSQKEEFDTNILNHLKEEDVKWIQQQYPDQIKSAQRLGLLEGLKPTKKCSGVLKSAQTINGKKLS